jgi:hypothetical protein
MGESIDNSQLSIVNRKLIVYCQLDIDCPLPIVYWLLPIVYWFSDCQLALRLPIENYLHFNIGVNAVHNRTGIGCSFKDSLLFFVNL